MATAPKTAGFVTPGLQSPYAAEQANLGLEQQMLLQALQGQQDVSVPTRQTGAVNVLNFDGVGNAIAGQRSRQELEVNRKKQLDVAGKYSEQLVQEMKRFRTADPDKPQELAPFLDSPYPEIRSRAEDEMKSARERLGKALEKADPTTWKNGGMQGIGGLAPKPEQTVIGKSLVNTTPGQPIALVPGSGFKQVPDPNNPGQQVNQSILTGEMEQINRASQVHVNSGQKADETFLIAEAKKLSDSAEKINSTVPTQLRALASVEQAARSGAIQGPVSGLVQFAAGLATQFGLSSEHVKQLLANTEILNSDMGRFVLQAVRALGVNPSNADREYAAQTAGGQKLSPAGLEAVIRASRVDLVNSMIQHNKQVDKLKTEFPKAELARVEMPELANIKGKTKVPFGVMDVKGFLPGPDGIFMPEVRANTPAGQTETAAVETPAQKSVRLAKELGFVK